MNANAEMMIDAAVIPTLKLRANVGSAGAISPNPRAMTKFELSSTQISRGICFTPPKLPPPPARTSTAPGEQAGPCSTPADGLMA